MNNDDQLTNKKKPNQENNQTIVGSASVYGKEKEAVKTSSSLYEVKEMQISKEAEKEGVIQKKEEIEIPEEISQIGVAKTSISVPVPHQPTLKLPLSDEEIEEGRHKSLFFSIRWLSEFCLYQLKKVHLLLKVIHGKVKRVRKN